MVAAFTVIHQFDVKYKIFTRIVNIRKVIRIVRYVKNQLVGMHYMLSKREVSKSKNLKTIKKGFSMCRGYLKGENMKRRLLMILTVCLMIILLSACSNSEDKVPEVVEFNDQGFLINLAHGLENRWALNLSKEYNPSAIEKMSAADSQQAHALFVNVEYDAIGDIGDYVFENEEIHSLAETYMKGLALQKEGAQYQGTTDYAMINATWELGYCYRTVALHDLYINHGLTVDKKYKKVLQTCLDDELYATLTIYLTELENTEYVLDEESYPYSGTYIAVIENTTEYTINNLTIHVNFLDEDGVIIHQTSDFINDFAPGTKVQSKVYCTPHYGDVASTRVWAEARVY